ncbi:MAG: hypothetical protein COA52_15710 [Hyphomicrobiales bacterium]|nr:MAG: hypothetical protein COA52_15710 [Hyphomicrobiales bacterium]
MLLAATLLSRQRSLLLVYNFSNFDSATDMARQKASKLVLLRPKYCFDGHIGQNIQFERDMSAELRPVHIVFYTVVSQIHF